MSILGGILEELGVAAFVRLDDQSFKLLSNHCLWFSNLYNALRADSKPASEGEEDSLVIAEQDFCQAFPFIEHFLIDAQTVWDNPGRGSVNSGIWTETDLDGNEYPLEARACHIQSQLILLIENHSSTFGHQHAVYQKARNIALLNEKLVSELNQRQRELQSEIERHLMQDATLQGIADAVSGHTSGVMVCQPNGKVAIKNKALVDIYKVTNGNDLRRASLLEQWMTEAEEQYPELKRIIETGSYWEGEFESSDSSENRRWVRLTIGPVKDKSGTVAYYVCVANDITDLRSVEGFDAEHGAGGYDFTTRLPNRRHFWQHIHSLAKNDQPQGRGTGLLIIDLDYFKRVNDDLGHQAGDFLLSAIASRISRNVKHNDFVGHLGGDEFVVLVRSIESDAQLTAVASRLLGSIHEPISVDGQPMQITASIGISTCYESVIDPTLLVRQADLAMYAAKELGKGQSRFYDPSMESSIPHNIQRERELVDAISNQQFVLHLQPQVCVRDTKQFKAEALVRWQHPQLGLLPPADFIAIAEASGLIIPLGNWVLMQACRIGADLNHSGKPVCIAVNISAKQLKHPDFYQTLENCLEQTAFPAALLEIEITESCFLEDMESVIRLLEKIRLLGVTISLDDFGTGFSSFNYLRQLPVDYLKIDRSFVKELPEDRESRAITSSIISLAHELTIEVVAEGVENSGQFNFLCGRNVNFIQGFLLFKPMPVEEFVRLFSLIEELNGRNKWIDEPDFGTL
jgi:diguanylate cyclase (GGDEF)-like protein